MLQYLIIRVKIFWYGYFTYFFQKNQGIVKLLSSLLLRQYPDQAAPIVRRCLATFSQMHFGHWRMTHPMNI